MTPRKLIAATSLLVAGVVIACNRQTTSSQTAVQEETQAQPPLQGHQLTPPAHPEQGPEAAGGQAEATSAASGRAATQQPSRRDEPRGGLRERETAAAGAASQTPPARTQSDAREAEAAETRPPAPPPPRRATLEAGAAITVRTTSEISTKTATDGERFTAHLEKPLTQGSWVIAPKGALVEGVVADADKGGRVKGRASLTLRLTRLHTADGQSVSIDTTAFSQEAKSGAKKDAAKVGIASGVGAAIGAIAGGGKGAAIGAAAGAAGGGGMVAATRGEAATIPAESVLTFELTSPVQITENR